MKNPAAKAPIKRTSPEDWLYEHVIHNILFPECAYEFVGILGDREGIRIVLRQQAVRTESFPEEEQVSVALAKRGLLPEDRYFFGDGVVSVTDVGVHGDNVLLDDAGNVRFIDPLIRLKKRAEDVIEWLTGYNPNDDRNRKTNGFTLIELLVICAILATMVTIGVGTIRSGQGSARVKGATRDVYAAIRHARSVALVTGQRVLVTYSNETEDDEPVAKVDVVSAKIMNMAKDDRVVQPYYVMDYKDLPQKEGARQDKYELVHIRKASEKDVSSGTDEAGGGKDGAGGETLEEVLFSPMNTSVVKGMRLKAVKGEEAVSDETDVQRSHRISMSSNVDWLLKLYKGAKAESDAAKEKESGKKDASAGSDGASSADDMQEPVSVTWETNGAVEPHKVWIYAAGQKPEQGLLLNIDRFGTVKVLDGDGREEED